MHKKTRHLPTFEMCETGRQVWKSSRSARSNLVVGYGRQRYKNDFIRFVIYAFASNDGTIGHIESLWECGSMKDENLDMELKSSDIKSGEKLNHFLTTLIEKHSDFSHQKH